MSLHRSRRLPIVAATAIMILLGAGAASVSPPVGNGANASTAQAAVTPNPLGAEDWMHWQRANADGTIPDAAVADAVEQSGRMGATAMRSPSTDQVWAELGPSNIGGRIRDLAPDPTRRDVVYIATATGGLWRSNDGGLRESMGLLSVAERQWRVVLRHSGAERSEGARNP